jgi:hypothetical protein
MREINGAYTLLHEAAKRPVSAAQTRAASSEVPHHESAPSHSLTDIELDAIVRAIGTDSPVNAAIQTLAWVVSLFFVLRRVWTRKWSSR